jgi:hypothetical protein
VGFYIARARKLFFYFSDDNGLPNQCKVFSDVAAAQIADTLNAYLGIDLGWLLTVSTPKHSPLDRLRKPNLGAQLSFLIEANTFPPSR